MMLDDFTIQVLDDLAKVFGKSRSELVRELVKDASPMLIQLASVLKPLEQATHEERLKIFNRLEEVNEKLTKNAQKAVEYLS